MKRIPLRIDVLLDVLLAQPQHAASASRATSALTFMMRIFAVAADDEGVVREALRTGVLDFEDGITAAAAGAAPCELIVTRNARDFQRPAVRAVTPEMALPPLG